MDLATLKQKILANTYQKPSELANDMRLIFNNAMTYNDPKSRVYSHAKSLGEYWESAWAQLNITDDILDRPPTIDAMTDFVEKCHRFVDITSLNYLFPLISYGAYLQSYSR